MKEIINKKEQKLYQCEECGLYYSDREWAGKCEAWCRERHSCNLDIIDHAEKDSTIG